MHLHRKWWKQKHHQSHIILCKVDCHLKIDLPKFNPVNKCRLPSCVGIVPLIVHSPALNTIKLVRLPISVGSEPVTPVFSVYNVLCEDEGQNLRLQKIIDDRRVLYHPYSQIYKCSNEAMFPNSDGRVPVISWSPAWIHMSNQVKYLSDLIQSFIQKNKKRE